jgi:flagella basal body P-ring formation protein FlgA
LEADVMTTTLSGPRSAFDGPVGSGDPPVGIEPVRRRQRSVPLAVVALLCMAVSVVAFVGIQLSASDRVPVLAVARPVEAGAVLTDADLRVAQVASDPVLSPIPVSARDRVVGRTAAVDLAPGSLLVESSLGEPSVVGDGEVLVGVEVSAAAAPVGAIRAGDAVRVVEVDAPAASTTGSGTVLTEGRVLRVTTAESSTTAGVSQLLLVVPDDAGAAVAAASMGQRVAVVVVP